MKKIESLKSLIFVIWLKEKVFKSTKGDISSGSIGHQSNSYPWNQSKVMMILAKCRFNHDVAIRCQSRTLILFQYQKARLFLDFFSVFRLIRFKTGFSWTIRAMSTSLTSH